MDHQLKELSIKNNYICRGKVNKDQLDKFIQSDIDIRYQLLLSVIHWWNITNTLNEFQYYLTKLFSKAFVTYIELPTVEDDTAYVADWYYNYNEDSLLRMITNKMEAKLEFIGYENATVKRDAKNRKLFKITNNQYKQKHPFFLQRLYEFYIVYDQQH